MKNEQFIDCERARFDKMLKFRLPHRYLKVGVFISVLAIVSMFVRAFALDGEVLWLKALSKKVLLIGMLMMSLSKDKEEDEMVVALRSQSYAIAFIVGVLYALIMPYVELGVSQAVNATPQAYKDLGDFQVLLFMLMIQLLFFHNLKRYR